MGEIRRGGIPPHSHQWGGGSWAKRFNTDRPLAHCGYCNVVIMIFVSCATKIENSLKHGEQ